MAHSSVSLAYTLLSVLLCICSLHTVQAMATKEKQIHLTYYGFEIKTSNFSSTLLAAGTGSQINGSTASFGSFIVFDNELREESTENSTLVGRYTGTLEATSTEPIVTTGGLLMTAQFIFGEESKYNASSILVMGSVGALELTPWELVILGGTNHFRGCMGYTIATGLSRSEFKYDFYLSC